MPVASLTLAALLAAPQTAPTLWTEPTPLQQAEGATILRDSSGALVTTGVVSGARQLDLDGGVRVVQWTRVTDGVAEEQYRIRYGADQAYARVRTARPAVHLRRGAFDPLVDERPAAPEGFEASGDLHVVQFTTQPIDAYRETLGALGAEVRHFLPETAHLVEMDSDLAEQVRALPFVRWVGPYRAADRIDPVLLDAVASGELPGTRVHVQVTERGPAMKGRVAARVPALGGEVAWIIDEGFRFDAVVDAKGLLALASMDEVLWIDPWTEREEDMDKVRVDGGADSLENLTGFSGMGVRAEAMDGGLNTSHPDLQSNPVIVHGSTSGSQSHGTPVTGIVFGDGAANAARRGLLPDAQGIFADYGNLSNRYTHTAELLNSTYQAVFQTNSWGNSRTRAYTSISMEMDDILFQNDIVILQSQSNAGNQDSRPQAWAKNVVAVGGIRHQDTQTTTDDAWSGGGSTGPAADGRLKPDLSYWYDSILTTGSDGGSTSFGGTSAATPMTAGFFGLYFQMWHEGVFGNVTSSSVFASRPKATLSRALMINSAEKYSFSGSNADLRRTTQGWGRANVQNLYDARGELFWVNEDVVLTEGQSVGYPITVEQGTPELAVTMVYLDPAGTTSASIHRINDLSLRVTAPNGTTSYWGNNGLASGNASSAGGASNERDTVENVFVQNPAAGQWFVEVFADDLNQDGHVETTGIDADFALVVRGTSTTTGDPCLPPSTFCDGAPNSVFNFGAEVFTGGSNSVAANDLTFVVAGMPPTTFALAAASQNQQLTPLGGGTLCLGSPIVRIDIVQADLLGQAIYALDYTGGVGETWTYQFWYRDGASFNFSDAVEVTWCD